MYNLFGTALLRIPSFSTKMMEQIRENNGLPPWLLENEFYKSAIYFASPDLYQELRKYISGEITKEEKKHVEKSLLKYLIRMSSRCTPFGLFAACVPCDMGESTNVIPCDTYKLNIRFDMFYLCMLAQHLSKEPILKLNITYRPNTTLYVCGNKYHYIEYLYKENKRVFQLVGVPKTRLLNKILQLSKNGVSIKNLEEKLLTIYDVGIADIHSYIIGLVENQFLVSELEPTVTGEQDFFSVIKDVVFRIMPNSKIYSSLQMLDNMLQSLNGDYSWTTNEKKIVESCDMIKKNVRKLGVPFKDKYLFQVDFIRYTQVATIGISVIEKLKKVFEILNKISSHHSSSSLQEFVSKFVDRYEKQEVPLMEALNPEIGIGYPIKARYFEESLTHGLKIPVSKNGMSRQIVMTPLQTLLLQKLLSFNVETDNGICLTDEDLAHFPSSEEDLQETAFIMFELISISNDEEPTLLVKTLGGGSGANLLARFAYLDDRIKGLVQNIVEHDASEHPDAIVAEIVHIPNNRIGNVLTRPSLRSHEIVYLANSIREMDKIIYPDDLMISVRDNQIQLRSKSRNKYIYPKLTTAHNYYNDSTPLYRFLCELQHQGKRSGLGFSWSGIEHSLKFFPRIYYEDILLSACKWHLEAAEVDIWRKINDESNLLQIVAEWQMKNHIPQYTYLCEGDNRLLIDWSCAKTIRIFLEEVRKHEIFILEEAFNICNSMVNNQLDGYANECVAVFYRERKKE